MKLPSAAQARLLRVLEEHGPLPDYYNQATTRAIVRHKWAELREDWTGRSLYPRVTLSITTRGRWALRRLDAKAVAA